MFNTYITDSEAGPNNLNVMNNKIRLDLDHENYSFSSGFDAYEKLNIGKTVTDMNMFFLTIHILRCWLKNSLMAL